MRKAVITQTYTKEQPSKALETIVIPESKPAVADNIKEILNGEQTQAYYDMVALVTNEYIGIIDSLKEGAKKGNFHSVKLTLEALRDMSSLLGLKAATKTVSTNVSSNDVIDLSGYHEVGT